MRGEERPLVVPRLESLRIEELRCAALAAVPLERERDQVPEAGLGQEVLGGEEPVVALQVHLGA